MMAQDGVLLALRSLYSASSRDERLEADCWLREWQKSECSWEQAMQMLRNRASVGDEAVYFFAQTLRTKLLFDFHQLPPGTHEPLVNALIDAIRVHRDNKPALIQLSLGLSALSVHLAQSLESPLQLALRACNIQHPVALTADHDVYLLLLLLTHLAEEGGNRKILVDDATRAAYSKAAEQRATEVIQLLVSLRRAGGADVKLQVVECCKSWIVLLRSSGATVPELGSNVSILFEDCFQILEAPNSTDEEASAAATCIVSIMRIVEGPLKRDRRGVVEDEATRISGRSFDMNLVHIAVEHCGGPLLVVLERMAEVPDIEGLASVGRVLVATASSCTPFFLKRLHEDVKLQRLLKATMGLVEAPRRLGLTYHGRADEFLQSQLRNPGEIESDLETAKFFEEEPLLFFAELADDFAGAVETTLCMPQSRDALRQMYVHLTTEVLQQIQLPGSVFTRRIGEEFSRFRLALDEFLGDAALVLGSVTVVEAILSRIRELLQLRKDHDVDQNHREATFEVPMEASLYAMTALLPLVKDEDSSLILEAPYAAVQAILNENPPATSGGIYSRVQCIWFMIGICRWVCDCTGMLETVVKLLASQLMLPVDPSARESMNALHCAAAQAMREFCHRGRVHHIRGFSQQLASVSNYLTSGGVCENAQDYLLEAVCILIVREPDTGSMLQFLEGLCQTSLTAIQLMTTKEGSDSRTASVEQEGVIERHLDRLAIILRDTQKGVRDDPQRLQAVGTFVSQTLWTLLQQLLDRYPKQPRIVEKSLRCLKHAMRTLSSGFKPIVPSLLEILGRNAEVELQSTYLYSIEWLALEFASDADLIQPITILFQHLSRLACSAIELQPVLEDSCHIIEDYYGMLGRFLSHCPFVVPTSAQTFRQGVQLCIRCMDVGSRDPVKVVFAFMQTFTTACKSESDTLSAAVSPIASQYLPSLVRHSFELLAQAPAYYIVCLIKDFIRTVVATFPEQSFAWLDDGLAELPTSVLPTDAQKSRLMLKMRTEEKGVCDVFDELSYRCEQVALRNRI